MSRYFHTILTNRESLSSNELVTYKTNNLFALFILFVWNVRDYILPHLIQGNDLIEFLLTIWTGILWLQCPILDTIETKPVATIFNSCFLARIDFFNADCTGLILNFVAHPGEWFSVRFNLLLQESSLISNSIFWFLTGSCPHALEPRLRSCFWNPTSILIKVPDCRIFWELHKSPTSWFNESGCLLLWSTPGVNLVVWSCRINNLPFLLRVITSAVFFLQVIKLTVLVYSLSNMIIDLLASS